MQMGMNPSADPMKQGTEDAKPRLPRHAKVTGSQESKGVAGGGATSAGDRNPSLHYATRMHARISGIRGLHARTHVHVRETK